MSTDYDVACLACRLRTHYGSRFAGSDRLVMGYGAHDPEGRKLIGQWMLEHAEHAALLIGATNAPNWVNVQSVELEDKNIPSPDLHIDRLQEQLQRCRDLGVQQQQTLDRVRAAMSQVSMFFDSIGFGQLVELNPELNHGVAALRAAINSMNGPSVGGVRGSYHCPCGAIVAPGAGGCGFCGRRRV